LEIIMACKSCAERRNLTMQAVNNIRRGEVAAAKQNAQRFVQTLRQDARKLVRSPLTIRPPR
jgi:septation ring formation regulator EzrA